MRQIDPQTGAGPGTTAWVHPVTEFKHREQIFWHCRIGVEMNFYLHNSHNVLGLLLQVLVGS